MINLQESIVSKALIFDKKTLSQRMNKLSEEQGELAEAILEHSSEHTLEEGIDTLLVAFSIYLDLKGSFSSAETLMTKAVEDGSCQQSSGEDMLRQYALLSQHIGKLAELVQKFNSVPTSLYKGKTTKEDLIEQVKMIMSISAFLVGMCSNDYSLINTIIFNKNAKWQKRAVEGFLQADGNSILHADNKQRFVSELSDIIRSMSNISSNFFEYEYMYDRIQDIESLEDIFSLKPHDGTKRDLVILNNVPYSVAEQLTRHRSSFKIICLV